MYPRGMLTAQRIEGAISTMFTEYFDGPTRERTLVGTGTDGASYTTDPDNYRHKHGIPEYIEGLIEPTFEDLSSLDLF